MIEEWREIPGYDGVFAISNTGRVKRLKNAPTGPARPGYIYTEHLASNGYATAKLYRNNHTDHPLIHRLVAELFIGPEPFPGAEVNHKNGIKNDNRVENLEWMTTSQNQIHAIKVLHKHIPRGEEIGLSKLTEAEVMQIRLLYSEGLLQKELAVQFKVSAKQISCIVTRKQWSHLPLMNTLHGSGDAR